MTYVINVLTRIRNKLSDNSTSDMKNLKKTEIVILIILWVMSLITCSIALFHNYILYTSDYLGFLGLTVVSLICLFKPEKRFQSVLTLLVLGFFNVLSFTYFFNIVMTFGFSVMVTPGVQLVSFVLIILLLIKRRKLVKKLYRQTFGQTKEERQQSKQTSKNRFKSKFEQLSDGEIENRLRQDLVPEAKFALTELMEERRNKTI